MAHLPRIVLVADPLDHDPLPEWSPFDRRHDRPWKSSVDGLVGALQKICPSVVLHTDLAEFAEKLPSYKDCLVLPYWFGENSRNRHGLVPAMCEAVGIPFIGPDAYAKIVCSDKRLSKSLCSLVDLQTPDGMLVYEIADLNYLMDCEGPFVVKPNAEGCSLGIDYSRPLKTVSDVKPHVQRILDELQAPVLIEKFIPGRETSVCLMGNTSRPRLMSLSWAIEDNEAYLDDRLFTAALKAYQQRIELVLIELDEATAWKCSRLFKILDKVEILRIDGRLHRDSGEFIVLELTTDIDLSVGGEWALLYEAQGYTYCDFIEALILNSLERRR